MGSGETVAVDFVKRWLAECEANHLHGQADAHHESASESPAIPQANILLIDVDQNKLVHANSSARYVALSYVWGQHGTTVHNFETTTATLDQLLTSLATVSGIPIVVLDAIQFVAAVGERYLWVDRLCIVQDDATNKHENISQMDIIYANAVFTVVAASGISGDIPLPGVRPGTRAPQVSPLAGGVRLKRGSQGRQFALNGSLWDTRGWTFQEMHLSRRRVIFTAHEVMCECAESAVAE
ncbi:heterokaryon incompatibility protein-domain-containing protein, partial [Fomes fomentarius]